MTVSYPEVMGAIGSVTMKHPQTSALGMQTYSNWSAREDDIKRLLAKYKETVAQVQNPGTLDKVGVFMQLAAQNPWFIQLVVQTLSSWQSRIPDGIQVLQEFQATSQEAYKS